MSTAAPDPEVIALIERAAATVGSEYKLAKALGVPQNVISDWKVGRRGCTPPDRARIAGFAQEDAVQELVRATLAQTAGTLRGEQLYKLLGKPLRATGAAMGTVVLAVLSSICLIWPTDSSATTARNLALDDV